MQFQVTPEEISEIYATLDRIGSLGEHRSAGFLRASYSDEETAAMKFIEQLAVACGASARWDGVGCLALEWFGASSEFVETASHLDTVPCGGNFDGAAGVIAGLTAIRSIIQKIPKLHRGLRLRVWRSEEFACFGVLYAGSKAAFGQLDPRFLEFKFRNKTLSEAMQSQGANPDLVRNGLATISQAEIDKISAHVELHIEQGNLLENTAKDIGIVTSIRSSKRYRVLLTGEFDHSGATPMGIKYRKDVNLALGYMSVELDKLYQRFDREGEDLVQTICVINSNRDFNEENRLIYTNATSVISGFGYFELEFRSNRLATLDRYTVEVEKVIAQVSKDFGVTAEMKLNGSGIPLEALDMNIQQAMQSAANTVGLSSVLMPCGAGHDAVIVGGQKRTDGKNIPVGMLLIPCLKGKSHNPEEFASDVAIANGATVLANGLYQLTLHGQP